MPPLYCIGGLYMQLNEIVQRVNEKLAGETLVYTQLVGYLDSTIDDINAKLNSSFPNLSEYVQSMGAYKLILIIICFLTNILEWLLL